MKCVHNIKLTVFSKEEEPEEKIMQAFISMFPFNLEEEKLTIDQKSAQGFNEKKIKIIELTLTKTRHTRLFLENLLDKLTQSQVAKILQQIESRLDDELFFYIRLDKTELLENDRYIITDSGNCFHIKMSVAAFPKTRDSAKCVIKDLLKQFNK